MRTPSGLRVLVLAAILPVAGSGSQVEMTADVHYYRLIQLSDGAIVSATGTGMEGTWTTTMNSYRAIQIEIQISGLGTDSILLSFFGSPHGVRFSGTGTSADYLRASIPAQQSPVTPTAPSAPPAPPTLPATGAETNLALLGLAALSMLSGTVVRLARRGAT